MGTNRYAYAGNDPVNKSDPNGHIIETAWDAANAAWSWTSAADNWSQGNYVTATIDAAGATIDTVAAAVPGAPGGATTAITGAKSLGSKIGNALGFGKKPNSVSPAASTKVEPKGGVYTLRDDQGNVQYCGASCNLERREAEHARDPVKGKFQFKIEHRTDDYNARLGLEQELYDNYENKPNKLLNRQRPISRTNKKIGDYNKARDKFHSELGGNATNGPVKASGAGGFISGLGKALGLW